MRQPSTRATVLLGLVACSARQGPSRARLEQQERTYRARVLHLQGGFRGLSGLTVDASGTLWAVPERQRRLVSLLLDESGGVRVGAELPIEGVAPHLDTESVTWLGEGRFALGCEASVRRAEEEILVLEQRSDRLIVRDTLYVPYAPWGITPEENQGIEGLCSAGEEIVLANENVIEENGARFAPVARYRPQPERWAFYRVRLTSESGKLAALACVGRDQDALELLAIERHFSVRRIVRFALPQPSLDSTVLEVRAHLHTDLASPAFGDINPEGLVRRDDGSLLLLGDNDYGGPRGPTPLVVLTPQ